MVQNLVELEEAWPKNEDRVGLQRCGADPGVVQPPCALLQRSFHPPVELGIFCAIQEQM